jgi:hypothetical protein
MNSTRNPGRVAGLWYLLLTLIGPLRLIYIPNKLFVTGDATATVNNIAAHEWLFRFGILGDMLCGLILIFLVLAFYRLFKGVDQNLAVQVVIFGGVMPAIIDFVSVVNDAAALAVVRGAEFLSVFDKPQRDAALDPEHCRRVALGRVATATRGAGIQVAFPAAFLGRLARHQRVRVRDHQFYGDTVAAIPGRGL